MPKVVEYFFSIGSPWSYIGFDAFLDLAHRYELQINPYLGVVTLTEIKRSEASAVT